MPVKRHDVTTYVCDACGKELKGTEKDFTAGGWRSHAMLKRKRDFVMCKDCEEMYAERRRLRKAMQAVDYTA